MKAENVGRSSPAERKDRVMKLLVRDLADLARAQAKLTADLLELLDVMPETERQFALQIDSKPADTIYRGEGYKTPPAEQDETEFVSAPPESEPVVEDPETPLAGRSGVTALAPERAVIERPGPPIEAVPEPEEAEDAAVEEGEEEEERTEPQDATVLVLESGDARVGVLWDQVVQIGSLSTPAVPDRIGTEHGSVDLVSLGSLLHGVSREEKYFVVLAREGEKAAVACERMLGLGPIASAAMQERDSRIQVLDVGLLKTFAKGAQKFHEDGGKGGEKTAAQRREEEERDRIGPRRALVAVRYLPARVAICRYLRGRGWQVGEAAGLEAAIVSLDLGRWDALFLEARANGGTGDEAEEALLSRVGELGVPVIRVGSRISGYPAQGGPALMFPFSETELDAVLAVTRGQPGS